MSGIGDWDSGYLLRFIRAALSSDPIPPGAVLQVEDVIVKGDIDFTKGRLRQTDGAADGDVLTMQNGTWKALPRLTGRVTSAGAVSAGTGYTVTKLATGQYQINFNTAFAAAPCAWAIADNTGSVYSNVVEYANCGTNAVTFLISNAGTAKDCAFMFSIIPML